MAIDTNRRRLFSRKKQSGIRPPWTEPSIEFTDLCTRCNKCITACETQVLVSGDGGFPEINFKIDECSFCQKCVDVCPEPIFNLNQDSPWQITASIKDNCLANQGVWCQSCKDACEAQAITFSLAVGKAPQPQVDVESCTGCGACVSICPSDAINIQE